MDELITEITVEILGVIGSAAGALVFTLGGLLAEQEGIRNLLTGRTIIGTWEAGMGMLLLFTGIYLLGYHECWARLRTLRRSDS